MAREKHMLALLSFLCLVLKKRVWCKQAALAVNPFWSSCWGKVVMKQYSMWKTPIKTFISAFHLCMVLGTQLDRLPLHLCCNPPGFCAFKEGLCYYNSSSACCEDGSIWYKFSLVFCSAGCLEFLHLLLTFPLCNCSISHCSTSFALQHSKAQERYDETHQLFK